MSKAELNMKTEASSEELKIFRHLSQDVKNLRMSILHEDNKSQSQTYHTCVVCTLNNETETLCKHTVLNPRVETVTVATVHEMNALFRQVAIH